MARKVIDGGFKQRAEPPAHMPERQKELWRKVAASESVDWFQTEANRQLLELYVASVDGAQTIQKFIDGFPVAELMLSDGIRRYNALLSARQSEQKTAYMLATKLRLTNQSRYDRNRAATVQKQQTSERKPWEFTGTDE